MLALRYVGDQLTGAAEFAPFDQSDTTANRSAATMTAGRGGRRSTSTCRRRTSISGSRCRRRKATTLAMNWSVNAAPGWEIANGTGPQLEAAGVALDRYGRDHGAVRQPVRGEGLEVGVHAGRPATGARSRCPSLGNLVGTFYCGLNEIAEVAPGLTLDTPAALPIVVSINSMPLATDGQNIALDPTKAVALSILADKTDALFYQFNIYELRGQRGDDRARDPRRVRRVTRSGDGHDPERRVRRRQDLLHPRSHDQRRLSRRSRKATFGTRNLPYSVGYLDAGVFTVSAP